MRASDTKRSLEQHSAATTSAGPWSQMTVSCVLMQISEENVPVVLTPSKTGGTIHWLEFQISNACAQKGFTDDYI